MGFDRKNIWRLQTEKKLFLPQPKNFIKPLNTQLLNAEFHDQRCNQEEVDWREIDGSIPIKAVVNLQD